MQASNLALHDAVAVACRLNMQAGHDVRCPAALLTYKMAAITSRAGPAGGVGAAGQGGNKVGEQTLC
jgi:hypothetical protein